MSRPKNGPIIQFESLALDKGVTAPITESVVFDFQFQNLGNTPLEIKQVHKNCSCLKADFPTVIEPRESGTISLKYSTLAVRDQEHFSHEIVVECNDPVYPFVQLMARGTVSRRIGVLPRKIVVHLSGQTTPITEYVQFRLTGLNPDQIKIEPTSKIAGISCRWIPVEEYREKIHKELGGALDVTFRQNMKFFRILQVDIDPAAISPGLHQVNFTTSVIDSPSLSVVVEVKSFQ